MFPNSPFIYYRFLFYGTFLLLAIGIRFQQNLFASFRSERVRWSHCTPKNMCFALHVVKEFGFAAHGGVGSITAGLVNATMKSIEKSVVVLIPFYTYFNSTLFGLPEIFSSPLGTVYSAMYSNVPVLLISTPLCTQFPLPDQWNSRHDKCFASGAASFIHHFHTSIRIIHVHSTAALLLRPLMTMLEQSMATDRPALVFTLQYYMGDLSLKPDAIHADDVRVDGDAPAFVGALYSDVVIIGSRSAYYDILFPRKGILQSIPGFYPPILRRLLLPLHAEGRSFGITNSLSMRSGYANSLSLFEQKVVAKQNLQLSGLFNQLHPSGRPMLLYIGRVDSTGLYDDLYACAQACSMFFLTCGIVVLSSGPLAPEYSSWVRVTPELIAIARMAADFAFVPADNELFGYAAAEALSYGSMVISSGLGGVSDYLTPCKPGIEDYACNAHIYRDGDQLDLLRTVSNAVDMYERIRDCCNISLVVDSIASKSFDFSWQRNIIKYVDIYHRAVQIKESRKIGILSKISKATF